MKLKNNLLFPVLTALSPARAVPADNPGRQVFCSTGHTPESLEGKDPRLEADHPHPLKAVHEQ